jgi:KDO2-lipid IV(A) lauroyltransferase
MREDTSNWFQYMLMLQKIGDYLVYLLIRILFCIVQSWSLETGQKFARGAAFFFVKILPIRRRLLRENLQTAFPNMEDDQRQNLILAMWEHLLLLGIEVAHARRKIRDLNWTDHIKLVGAEPLLSLLHQDRPVIIITGHFGNFEIGGFSLGILSYPSHAVARKLDNPYLNQFVKEFRESTGQFLIDKKGGAPEIIRVLEHQGLLAFLVDQSAGRKSCMVKFFGKTASTYKAMAVLSMQFHAPLVVCYSLRQRDSANEFKPLHFEMHITGVLDPLDLPPEIQNVKDITQWFTHALESGIRQQPDQYWWLHRRWKAAETIE